MGQPVYGGAMFATQPQYYMGSPMQYAYPQQAYIMSPTVRAP